MDSKERYWVRVGTLPWQEATKEQFIKAEQGAGFRSNFGPGHVATASFSGGGIEGRTTYGEIMEKDYGWDPEFLKVALAKK